MMALRFQHPHGESPPPPNFALSDVQILPMRRRHVRAVLAIEEQVFPTPWSFGLYMSELAQPAVRGYFVARHRLDVVGYGGIMLAVGDAHVTTLAVAPAWQHLGIGRVVLLRLAHDARRRGCTDLTLEVRASNEPAQALYREFGFVPAGIRKNYYSEIGEDAIIMWAHDIDGAEYSHRLAAIEAKLR